MGLIVTEIGYDNLGDSRGNGGQQNVSHESTLGFMIRLNLGCDQIVNDSS